MIAFFDSQIRRQKRFEENLGHTIKSNLDEELNSDDLSSLNSSDSGSSNEESDLESESDNSAVSNQSVLSTISRQSSESSSSISESLNQGADNNIISPRDNVSSIDSEESDENSDNDLNLDNFEDNSLSKKKRRLLSLRDRLRNLRHRLSLNLTHEPDYLNVLGSLNVLNNENEIPGTSQTLLNGLNLEQDTGIEILTGELNENSDRPTTSNQMQQNNDLVSIKSESMKNLKNQKRKIEMNEDEDENVETQIRMVEAPIREDESLVVSFKRYKRNNSKNDAISSQNDPSLT